jgi:hypothetical protein
MEIDALGRPVIDGPIRDAIRNAFDSIPEGKKGALLLVADQDGVRLHVAARIGDHWKVAAGAGVTVDKGYSYGVSVEATW